MQLFYEELGRLPAGPAELGIEATRTPYPDVGYFLLDEKGRIVIRFTVLPELTRGRLILTPVPEDGTLKWKCRQEGSIEPGHLPADCRD